MEGGSQMEDDVHLVYVKFREYEATLDTDLGSSIEDYQPWLDLFEAGWKAHEKFVLEDSEEDES